MTASIGTTTKIDKFGFIKIKHFHASKGAISKVKKHIIKCANHISEKGLECRICK